MRPRQALPRRLLQALLADADHPEERAQHGEALHPVLLRELLRQVVQVLGVVGLDDWMLYTTQCFFLA